MIMLIQLKFKIIYRRGTPLKRQFDFHRLNWFFVFVIHENINHGIII